MKAIIIGGSGATGKALVQQLLEDPEYNELVVLLRRPFFPSHPKLTERVVDLSQPEQYKELIDGDVAFTCLGTTLKDAGSKEAQWLVDHDYNLNFAKACYERGIRRFVLLSSIGAQPNAKIFYSKMKGQLEEHIKEIAWQQLVIFRPGGLIRPGSTRQTEVTSMKLLQWFNRLGLFRAYEPLPVARVAGAMRMVVKKTPASRLQVLGIKEIKHLSEEAGLGIKKR